MKKLLFFRSFLIAAFLVTGTLTTMAATITVTSSENSGAGTLREAIETTSVANDTIVFSISNSISVFSSLMINHPLHIDGSGQTIGAYTAPSSAVFYLLPGAEGTTLSGMAMISAYYGIYVNGIDGLTVLDCRIGTDYSDATGRGHNQAGIYLRDGKGHVMGRAGQPNIISGNGGASSGYGIYLAQITASSIQGNILGLASDGVTALPNGGSGILITGSNGILVGGNRTSGEGNIISGNGQYGVALNGVTVMGNTLCGNIIGLDATQSTAITNGIGVLLLSADGNRIGLPINGYGNIIAGHTNNSGIYFNSDASYNIVQNNYIGLSSTDAPFENSFGIGLFSGHDNLIGGNLASVPLARNIISGNESSDIYIGSDGDNNTICGNYIGLDTAGINAVSNGSGCSGITIWGDNNLIGGINDGTHQLGNIISGHSAGYGNGISQGSGNDNTIAGNIIGLNTSDAAVPNYYGININTNATNTLIGGNIPGSGNIISGNTRDAIRIYANSGPTSGHVIMGNYFGLSPDGLSTISNSGGFPAISLYEANNCTLGGNGNGEKNIITGYDYGILFSGNSSSNTITGNWIGVHSDLSPSTTPPQVGVLGYSSGNFVGTKGTGQGNLIANSTTGIYLEYSSTLQNGLFGNTISAFSSLGIQLADGANSNKSQPTITSAHTLAITGTSDPNDFIEIFIAESNPGAYGGSLNILDTATSDGSGNWEITSPIVPVGAYVCAIATDSNNNSSAFSQNAIVQPPPTMTSTPTITFTATASPTPTATPSITATSTVTPTATQTTTRTPTGTITLTSTVTPSVTPTATITQTATITLTATPSPTTTASPSSTPTNSLGNIELNGLAILAYPNPAMDHMQFLIHLESAADIELNIYNMSGEQIAQIKQSLASGRGQVLNWNCDNVAPGIYLIQVLADQKELGVQKIAIVK